MSQELIKRLEAATEGNREIDAEIMVLSYNWEQRHIGCSCWEECYKGGKHLDWVWVDPQTDRWITNSIQGFLFTTSIDAAVALAKRVLPGWNAHISTTGRAAIDRRDMHSRYEATAPTPALALCIAILKAKEV